MDENFMVSLKGILSIISSQTLQLKLIRNRYLRIHWVLKRFILCYTLNIIYGVI